MCKMSFNAIILDGNKKQAFKKFFYYVLHVFNKVTDIKAKYHERPVSMNIYA